MDIPPRKIVKAFATSVGQEKARDIVDDAAQAADVDTSSPLSEDEAVALLRAVSDVDGTTSYVRIAANTLLTRIQTGDMDGV